MCGINGILYFNRFNSDKHESYLEDYILNMNSEIAHRGPDGEGVLIDYPLCFGHRRLSILDLSNDAAQPMFNEDRSVVIVYNGEIYNYLELIPDLKNKGHKFKSKCDAEVIIHAYEEYGFDCVNKFNGMWAFAIYDFRKKLLFASRDRFGVKPFYYYSDNHQFIFSSEIKSILKVKHVTEANHGKAFDYLAYGYKTNNGETFFKNVCELKPAHNLIIESGNINISKYREFPESDLRKDDIKEELIYLLTDAVRLRYRSDVPVSILLSGGIDSGIITKLTDDLIMRNEISTESVNAYSAVFPGFEFDESENINELINSCLHISSVKLTPSSDNLINNIDKFVYGMGEPVFSTTSFAHYMLMKEIRKQNVKVVLNGQGADEAWCGYGKYIAGQYLLDILFSKTSAFFPKLSKSSSNLNLTYKYLLSQIIKAMLPRNKASYLRSQYQENIYGCLTDDFRKSNYEYFTNPDYKKISSDNLENYLKYNIEYQGFNQILHYEDHSSMQNSLEIRSPFIDYRIMDLAFSVSSDIKFNDGITKKIIRDSFKDKLPAAIIESKKKIGFVTPFENWLETPETVIYVNSILNSVSFKSRNIWDSDKIRHAFEKKLYRKGFPIWRIINFELWCELYKINNL